MDGARFKALGRVLNLADRWRVRTGYVVWTSNDATSGQMIALLMTPSSIATPTALHDFKNRGAVIKPRRNSEWSSNVLGAQDEWQGATDAGAHIHWYVTGHTSAAAPSNVGFLTFHGTIELDGFK